MRKSIHSYENAVLRGFLRQLRTERQLTQTDLADKLGVLQSMISEVERGERILDFLELRQYLDALGVSFHDFLDGFDRNLLKSS